MRNRAKCRLCEDIIESRYHHDYMTCKCKEISIGGGDNYWKCWTKNINFIRIDDQGNELFEYASKEKTLKEIALDELVTKIRNYSNLPDHIKWSPINHVDLLSVLELIKKLFESKE